MPSTASSLARLIEDLLSRLSSGTLGPGFSRTLQRGSAQGTVAVVAPPEEPQNPLLVVTFEVMRVPQATREALFERLLSLNGDLGGRAAFSLSHDGHVCLQAGRPIADLDAGELIELIVWTADKADDYDDLLIAEFGGTALP